MFKNYFLVVTIIMRDQYFDGFPPTGIIIIDSAFN